MRTKINYLIICLIIVLFGTSRSGFGQEKRDQKVVQIETKDGNLYTGEVITRDSVRVLFKSDKLGEITLQRADIKKITPVDVVQSKGGKYWPENPQSTRYFFSPNGHGLKKGEGYYQNIWVLMNSFAIGINDYVSVGGGLIPLFLFAGAPTPVWGTVKLSIPVSKNKFNVGAGVLAGTIIGSKDYTDSNTTYGIFYGLATFGSRDINASIGAGYGFAGGSVSGSPMLNISGMYRIGPRGYLLTENYLFTGDSSVALMMFGARTIIKNAGLDYGLLFPLGGDSGSVAVPWLGITIPLGGKK